MMFKRLLTNKKIVIAVVALFLVLGIGIILLVTKDSGKDEKKGANDDSLHLEILEPNEVPAEDSSDASGSWENAIESDTQTDNADASDKKEDADYKDNKNESNNLNDGDNEEKGEELEKEEEILEDDIIWGDIY